ncbi:MAG: TIGR03085 family metal-binding protein [Mycobacterium sp.]
MTAARRERAALVDTMRASGPDAPTLCEGWTTRDLAAHLVIRERRPDAMPGIVLSPLAGYTAKVQDQVAEGSEWDDLLHAIASGPPWYSPLKLVDSIANASEMFIHHEDVRRAQEGWAPRVLDNDTVSSLRPGVRVMARMTMSGGPARVTFTSIEGDVLAATGKGPSVTVTGEIPELLMFGAGRDQASVTFIGDAEVIDAVMRARKGL